jgi:hypothetical protein
MKQEVRLLWIPVMIFRLFKVLAWKICRRPKETTLLLSDVSSLIKKTNSFQNRLERVYNDNPQKLLNGSLNRWWSTREKERQEEIQGSFKQKGSLPTWGDWWWIPCLEETLWGQRGWMNRLSRETRHDKTDSSERVKEEMWCFTPKQLSRSRDQDHGWYTLFNFMQNEYELAVTLSLVLFVFVPDLDRESVAEEDCTNNHQKGCSATQSREWILAYLTPSFLNPCDPPLG